MGGVNQNIQVRITNTGTETIEGWMLAYDRFHGTITNPWNGVVSETALSQDIEDLLAEFDEDFIRELRPLLERALAQTQTRFTYVRNAVHNALIPPGESREFGYTLTNATGIPASIVMAQGRVAVANDTYSAELNVVNSWGGAFNGEIVLSNLTDQPLEWWELTFGSNFTITEMVSSWAATPTSHGNGRYTFKGTYTGVIPPHSSVSLGFQAQMSGEPMIVAEGLTAIFIGTPPAASTPPNDPPSGGGVVDEDDEIEYRISLDAVYDTVSGAITVSWLPAVAAGDFEVLYSVDGVNYQTSATVRDGLSYVHQTDGTDFVIKYFKVVQTVGDATVHSNADYVIWSPPGVCWTDYTRLWRLSDGVLSVVREEIMSLAFSPDEETEGSAEHEWAVDFDALSRVNTEYDPLTGTGNPFPISVAFRAAGNPLQYLRVVNSGYFHIMQVIQECDGRHNMILGNAPEFFYRPDLEVSDITLWFNVDSGLSGINNLNIFRWFDEINMSLPIKTSVDIANNMVYTEVDDFGAFALVDMTEWFAFLNDDDKFDESAAYNAIIGTSWETIALDAVPHPECGGVDTDEDGLRDWDELDTHGELVGRGLFKWDSTGITEYPTIGALLDNFSNVDLMRFADMVGNALSVEVLPIISNPARADSDGDGILDIFEHCKDYIRDLINRGRLTAHAHSDIDRWLEIENYEHHRGPLWHDTVESMYWGLLYSSDNTNRPGANGWLLDRVNDATAGRTALHLDGNTITFRFNIYFNFANFCLDGGGIHTNPECRARESCDCIGINDTIRLTEVDERPNDEALRNELYLLAGEYARANGKEDGFVVDFNNITFEWLAAAGIMHVFTSEFTGTIYDFFPGMSVNTRAVVYHAESRGSNGTTIDFQIQNRSGTSSGSFMNSRVEMRTPSATTVSEFARLSAHEVGHLIGGSGLADAYANTVTNNFNSRPYISNEGYRIAGTGTEIANNRSGIMESRDNREIISNDFEMILLAFVENDRQHHIPGTARPQSRAIKSNPIYHRRDNPARTLMWVRTFADNREIGRFIPVSADIREPYYANGFLWDYFVETRSGSEVAIILGIHSGDRAQSVVIPNSFDEIPVVEINNGAFWGETFREVTIHNNIEIIGINAFRNNTNLESVTFEAGSRINAIDSRSFAGTTSLRTITLPDSAGLTCIRTAAFRGSGLETITIPSSVDRIVGGAFMECGNLRSVIFEGAAPPLFGQDVFSRSNELQIIYVPCGFVKNYSDGCSDEDCIVKGCDDDCDDDCSDVSCIVRDCGDDCDDACSDVSCIVRDCGDDCDDACDDDCSNEKCYVAIETMYRNALPRLNISAIEFNNGKPVGLCDDCHFSKDLDHCICCVYCDPPFPCVCPLCPRPYCNLRERDCGDTVCPHDVCCKNPCVCACRKCFNLPMECSCVCWTCDKPEEHCRRYAIGDVNGDCKLDVADALAILRFLVNLSNPIGVCSCDGGRCRGHDLLTCTSMRQCSCETVCDDLLKCSTVTLNQRAWNAALITGISRENGIPRVNDALQILRFVVGLKSDYLDPIWNNGGVS
jgi:hypothetical protein